MGSNAAEAILLGFQHYLVMLGTTVIIPTVLVPQMGGGNVRWTTLLFWLYFSFDNECVHDLFDSVLGWESQSNPDIALCGWFEHSTTDFVRYSITGCYWWVIYICGSYNLYHPSWSLQWYSGSSWGLYLTVFLFCLHCNLSEFKIFTFEFHLLLCRNLSI